MFILEGVRWVTPSLDQERRGARKHAGPQDQIFESNLCLSVGFLGLSLKQPVFYSTMAAVLKCHKLGGL